VTAWAVDVRLLVVGDTGEATSVGQLVAADLVKVAQQPGPRVVRVIATGDLYYDRPPSDLSTARCAAAVSERYREFYSDALPQPVLAVAGNHDLYPPGDGRAFSQAAHNCTEAAFRRMGWLGESEPLASRVVAVDGDQVKVDVALVDWRLLGSALDVAEAMVPSRELRRDATFTVGVSHYPLPSGLTTGKCNEFEWNRELPATVPGADLWLNGHSHHLEAHLVGSVLDVTSGAGKELDKLKQCSNGRSFYRITANDPVPTGAASAGYTVIDLDVVDGGARATVTPVVCTVTGGCGPLADSVVQCVPRLKGGLDCQLSRR
jgi:predicted phosphodiesterase